MESFILGVLIIGLMVVGVMIVFMIDLIILIIISGSGKNVVMV